jgi:hypothetical protein
MSGLSEMHDVLKFVLQRQDGQETQMCSCCSCHALIPMCTKDSKGLCDTTDHFLFLNPMRGEILFQGPHFIISSGNSNRVGTRFSTQVPSIC